MTIEGLKDFGSKLQEDEEFNNQVRNAVESVPPSQAAEAASRVAQAHGCDVTAQELARGLEQIARHQDGSDELTEEELDLVSGGAFGWPWWWPLVLEGKRKPSTSSPKPGTPKP